MYVLLDPRDSAHGKVLEAAPNAAHVPSRVGVVNRTLARRDVDMMVQCMSITTLFALWEKTVVTCIRG